MITRNIFVHVFLRTGGLFMKKITKLMAVIALLGGVFGVALTRNGTIKAEAAAVTTKRVWLYADSVSWWENDPDTSSVGIYYWGGTTSIAWAGTAMLKDDANDLWYYDVPADTTFVKFTRIKKADPKNAYNKSVDINLFFNSIDHVNTYRFELSTSTINGELTGAMVLFTPVTSTVVNNFKAATDGLNGEGNPEDGICADTDKAGDLVTFYNDMLSTFERYQFNNLTVGSGVTGLQRITYLSSLSSITAETTKLNTLTPLDTEKNIFALTLIGIIGLSSIGGYYLLKEKKNV